MTKYCYNCGAELENDAQFCGQCGMKQQEQEQPPKPSVQPSVQPQTTKIIYQNAPTQKNSNGKSIAGFVISLLAIIDTILGYLLVQLWEDAFILFLIFPLLAFFLSWAGNTNQSNGLARAGMIISVIEIIVLFMGLMD